MEQRKAKQVLSDLYGLMMEMNIQREENEVTAELAANPDPQIAKHLINIRKLTAKANAHAQKLAFQSGIAKLKELKAKGIEELKRIFNPQEQQQLVTLFRKFDDTNAEDEADLLEDEAFLSCMQLLKKEIDDSEQPSDH